MGTTDEQESASESVLTVSLTAFEHSDVFHHVETMHRQSLSGVGFGIARQRRSGYVLEALAVVDSGDDLTLVVGGGGHNVYF